MYLRQNSLESFGAVKIAYTLAATDIELSNFLTLRIILYYAPWSNILWRVFDSRFRILLLKSTFHVCQELFKARRLIVFRWRRGLHA